MSFVGVFHSFLSAQVFFHLTFHILQVYMTQSQFPQPSSQCDVGSALGHCKQILPVIHEQQQQQPARSSCSVCPQGENRWGWLRGHQLLLGRSQMIIFLLCHAAAPRCSTIPHRVVEKHRRPSPPWILLHPVFCWQDCDTDFASPVCRRKLHEYKHVIHLFMNEERKTVQSSKWVFSGESNVACIYFLLIDSVFSAAGWEWAWSPRGPALLAAADTGQWRFPPLTPGRSLGLVSHSEPPEKLPPSTWELTKLSWTRQVGVASRALRSVEPAEASPSTRAAQLDQRLISHVEASEPD